MRKRIISLLLALCLASSLCAGLCTVPTSAAQRRPTGEDIAQALNDAAIFTGNWVDSAPSEYFDGSDTFIDSHPIWGDQCPFVRVTAANSIEEFLAFALREATKHYVNRIAQQIVNNLEERLVERNGKLYWAGWWGIGDGPYETRIAIKADMLTQFTVTVTLVSVIYDYEEIVGEEIDEVENIRYQYEDGRWAFADPVNYLWYGYGNPIPVTSFQDLPNTAYTSIQNVEVDNSPVSFQMYALKDSSGNDTNYVKLRDLASVLTGTAAQFNVSWSGAVSIELGKAYVPNGTEMKTPYSGNWPYAKLSEPTTIDGKSVSLDAIRLTDLNGNGYTYYKLRDLGKALGFQVGWDNQRGVYIETNSSRSSITYNGSEYSLRSPTGWSCPKSTVWR